MPDLIGILESFNRKERFFLVAQALGNPKFELSTGFREKLAEAVDLEPGIEIPANAFAAMDYHLNWVHASLVLAHYADEQERITLLNNKGIVSSQQDVDLLVAFKDVVNQYHLIFVEAKGYNTDGKSDGLADFDTGRERKQLKSKACQLDTILKPHGSLYCDIKPHYCLMTRKKPVNPPEPWGKWLKISLPRERLLVKYDSSVVKSGEDWKGRRGQGRLKVPPKGKA